MKTGKQQQKRPSSPVVPSYIVVKSMEHGTDGVSAWWRRRRLACWSYLRTECLEAIRAIAKESSDAMTGAGTVTNGKVVRKW